MNCRNANMVRLTRTTGNVSVVCRNVNCQHQSGHETRLANLQTRTFLARGSGVFFSSSYYSPVELISWKTAGTSRIPRWYLILPWSTLEPEVVLIHYPSDLFISAPRSEEGSLRSRWVTHEWHERAQQQKTLSWTLRRLNTLPPSLAHLSAWTPRRKRTSHYS